MIRLENLTLGYADRTLLKQVSTSFEVGRLTALIGRNGSGKSTLMRIMCGVFGAEEGSVLYDNENIWENTKLKEKIVYLSDEQYFIPHCTLADMRALCRE